MLDTDKSLIVPNMLCSPGVHSVDGNSGDCWSSSHRHPAPSGDTEAEEKTPQSEEVLGLSSPGLSSAWCLSTPGLSSEWLEVLLLWPVPALVLGPQSRQ